MFGFVLRLATLVRRLLVGRLISSTVRKVYNLTFPKSLGFRGLRRSGGSQATALRSSEGEVEVLGKPPFWFTSKERRRAGFIL